MAAEDITSLLEYMNSTKLGGDSDDDLPQEAKTQRTQGLETVLARAKELRQPESLDDLLAITQKLATGSRDGQFFFFVAWVECHASLHAFQAK